MDTLLAIIAALIIFGIFFDRIVGRIEDDDPDHGYTAIWVVIGVLVTVAASAFLVGWWNALLVLLAFAASGAPMILGSIRRHLRNRRRDRRAIVSQFEEITRGN